MEYRGIINSQALESECYPERLTGTLIEFSLEKDTSMECAMSQIIRAVSEKEAGFKSGDSFIIVK